MKWIYLTMFLTLPAFAEQLHTFEQVKKAALMGQSIRIAVDFGYCQSQGTQFADLPRAVGLYTPNEVAVQENSIAASLTHFTINNPEFSNQPVYEFVRYTLTPDNQLDLNLYTFDAKTYKSLSEKITYHCQLGTSAAQIYTQ